MSGLTVSEDGEIVGVYNENFPSANYNPKIISDKKRFSFHSKITYRSSLASTLSHIMLLSCSQLIIKPFCSR